MTRKSLQDWYNSDDISYSEKERLNKIGVGNYDYHYLIDLEQILRCEKWVKNSSDIRNKLDGRIKKIIFFTPNFNDDKPDASNYSCAIVTDSSDNNWVIVYRSSYVSGTGSDVVVKKVNISASEAERKLNGDYPVLAVVPAERGRQFNFLMEYRTWPYVYERNLPFDARNNPDKYILPLDIINRESDVGVHYSIYLGNEWVAELSGYESTFTTWYKFCNPSSSSSSSSCGSRSEEIMCLHPQIPFKRKEEIIRHIAKAVSHGYGGCSCHPYNVAVNNCEHLANGCVLGINDSLQGMALGSVPGPVGLVTSSFSLLGPTPLHVFDNFKDALASSPLGSAMISLEDKINMQKSKFENLTSSYSYQKGKIEQYAQEAECYQSYTRSKYRIEQEKFQERIVVYPKDWCRIS